MARIIGTPGGSAAARGALLVLLVPASILLFVGILSVWALSAGIRLGYAGLLVTAIGVIVIFVRNRDVWAKAAELVREGFDHFKGAQGEFAVHQALRALPDEFIVFHDFHPINRATEQPVKWNIDHIVAGPTGVFVIDAKNYGQPVVQSADRNKFTRRNVKQAQRNAFELKQGLVRWSAGDLDGLFVVPVVVYTQPKARTVRLREGAVRTIPLRLLNQEVQAHSEGAIDQEKAGRIARVLYAQLPADTQAAFRTEFDAFGELAKAARYAARDARLRQQSEAASVQPDESAQVQPSTCAEIPEVCPQCGGRLVRRTARTGSRAGKPFLGCENFPKTGCRYGFNLDDA